jgi:azurin
MSSAELRAAVVSFARPVGRRSAVGWTLRLMPVVVAVLIAGWLVVGGSAGELRAAVAGPIEFRIGVAGNTTAFSAPTLTVPAGRDVRVTFINDSRSMPHNWVVVDGASAAAQRVAEEGLAVGRNSGFVDPGSGALLAATPLANPRGSVAIAFTAPTEPGIYQFLCTVPGHYGGGMFGTLIVR